MYRFDHTAHTYTPNSLQGFDWSADLTAKDIFTQTLEQARALLDTLSPLNLFKYFKFAIKYRCEDRIFLIFERLLGHEDPSVDALEVYMDAYPALAYCVLKKFLPDLSAELPETLAIISACIIRNIIRSADQFGVAALVALERLALDIAKLDLQSYCDMLWWATHSIRGLQMLQETLLCMHEFRDTIRSSSDLMEYVHAKMLGIAFDRAEEASDTCPCDESGRPRRQRTRPINVTLHPPKLSEEAEEANSDSTLKVVVVAYMRVDSQTNVRLHSHVRLKPASPAETPTACVPVVDAVVTRATRGELWLDVKHPLPPEWETVDWLLYDAGSTATSRAMLDAVQTLAEDEDKSCKFIDVITGDTSRYSSSESPSSTDGAEDTHRDGLAVLNDSQREAVRCASPGKIALIWGPPGEHGYVYIHDLLTSARDGKDNRCSANLITNPARKICNQSSDVCLYAQR